MIDIHERKRLARTTTTSQVRLEELSRDPEIIVRSLVAANPNTPAQSFALLRRDTNWVVRHQLALNTCVPNAVLATLSHDHDPRVRAAIAINPATPPGILEYLCRDTSPPVRTGARTNLKLHDIDVRFVTSWDQRHENRVPNSHDQETTTSTQRPTCRWSVRW